MLESRRVDTATETRQEWHTQLGYALGEPQWKQRIEQGAKSYISLIVPICLLTMTGIINSVEGIRVTSFSLGMFAFSLSIAGSVFSKVIAEILLFRWKHVARSLESRESFKQVLAEQGLDNLQLTGASPGLLARILKQYCDGTFNHMARMAWKSGIWPWLAGLAWLALVGAGFYWGLRWLGHSPMMEQLLVPDRTFWCAVAVLSTMYWLISIILINEAYVSLFIWRVAQGVGRERIMPAASADPAYRALRARKRCVEQRSQLDHHFLHWSLLPVLLLIFPACLGAGEVRAWTAPACWAALAVFWLALIERRAVLMALQNALDSTVLSALYAELGLDFKGSRGDGPPVMGDIWRMAQRLPALLPPRLSTAARRRGFMIALLYTLSLAACALALLLTPALVPLNALALASAAVAGALLLALLSGLARRTAAWAALLEYFSAKL